MGVGIFGSASETENTTNTTTNTNIDEDTIGLQLGTSGGSQTVLTQSTIGEFNTSDFGSVQGGLGIAQTAVEASGKAAELVAQIAGKVTDAASEVLEDRGKTILQKLSEPVVAITAFIVGGFFLFFVFRRDD